MARIKATAAERLIGMKAGAEEKMTKAGARIGEKVILLRTNLSFRLHRIIHHVHANDEDECLEIAAETMTAATERRLRKEQEARERAEWERAMAREWSAYKVSSHISRSH